ncbi:hypothetical protein COCOBI_04-4820 [Coccomyxa sp. Obi]|nr:hypothetical protein COCOBI_04-4820 [Coccomyxa sp. Obi]
MGSLIYTGSSSAEVLKESRKKIGDLPLYVAAEQYPVDAWRVWSSTYKRSYIEGTPEFEQRLEYFKKTAQEVRERNAKHSNNPRKHLALNNLADLPTICSLLPEPYPGDIPYTMSRTEGISH